MAVLVRAHRWAQQTRGDVEARRVRKLMVVRGLMELGLTREEGREEGLEQRRDEGEEAGRFSAAREFLEELVEARFGCCDDAIKGLIATISAESELKRLARIAARASELSEFKRELIRN